MTRRDNISRALRCLGYVEINHSLCGTNEIALAKPLLHDNNHVVIFLGRNGAAQQEMQIGKKTYTCKLSSATLAALVSAGEYIFLCGSISTSEKRQIENLVP